MMIKSRISALLAGALLCTTAAAQAATSNTVVTFSVNMSNKIADASFIPGTHTVSARGTFNGYGTFALSPSIADTNIYEGTVTNTADPNGGKMEYKYHNSNGDNWEGTATGQNRATRLPETSGASLVLPTAWFNDGGPSETNLVTFRVDVAQQVNLGVFTVGTSTVEVRGGLNGWTGGASVLTNDPSILRTNQFSQVTSNVYTGTFQVAGSPGAAQDFKYVIDPGTIWDSPTAVNQNGGGNRYYDNVAQTLPLVDFSDQPYALLNNVTFQVDMSAQTLSGAYSNYPAYLAGSFNGWSTSATQLTNDPAAANTNIYSAVVTIGQGSTVYYKFTYQNNGTVWESPASTGGGDRSLLVPNTTNTTVPAVYFSDFPINDLLLQDTPVFFSIDMNGAVGTDAHVFNPSGGDRVFINGQFANWYAWYGGVNPAPAPAGYELFEAGLGTQIYTNTIIIPKGTAVAFSYKYGIGLNGDPGPTDNEASFGVNHFRVVRSTALNPYVMAQDKFGTMYSEPFFSLNSTGGGNLQVGTPSGGTVPVTWLGRPGAHLQVNPDLGVGSWQEIVATDGTNWTAGSSSTNGLVSQTNWPATDKAVFRLIKPNY